MSKGKPSVRLYIIIYATMFMFGLVENIKGVSFPLIKAEFGVNYDSQGGLVSMTWVGYVIFCLVASLFMQRYGIKKSMLAGYLMVGSGALATLIAPNFWTAGLTLLVVNAGFGFFEVGTNALGTIAFTFKAALLMNLMHFFYGFGAILGPKAAGMLTDRLDFNWRQVYIAFLIPTAVIFLFILFTKFNNGSDANSGEPIMGKVTFLTALKNPVVWLFCLSLGFMEVVEFGASNWGGLYLQDVYGLDPRIVGASFVSLFYILFTISRLISGWGIEKIGYMRSMYIAVGSIIVLFLTGFLLGRNGIWVLPFTGFFIAVLWPTFIAVAMQVFGADSPAVTSVIITVSGAVNAIFQLVIGLTSQYAGAAWGYRTCVIYSVFILVFLYFLSRQIKKIPLKAAPVEQEA